LIIGGNIFMSRKFWFSASLFILVLIPAVALVAVSKEPNDGASKGTKASKQTMEVKESNIVEPKRVRLETSMGDIVIELDEKKAPITVKNFLQYAGEGFYDGTIFHRVISNFMIQGGGFTADMAQKETHPPIVNEAKNGLKNDRGTVAMARTNNPDSATSQFFINHKNNDFLNYAGPDKPGYAVFGKVVEGMEVVDKIAAVETTTRGGMRDVPVKPVVIKSAKLVSGK
jgi:cyclophilin family peptidyl-prolyl cis-trans isomerase